MPCIALHTGLGWRSPLGRPAGLVVLRAVGLVLGTTLVLRYGVHRGGASRQPVGWHMRPGAPPPPRYPLYLVWPCQLKRTVGCVELYFNPAE
jgi:hypothetical protein